MSSPFFTLTSYVKYRLKAVNAHSLHSPFLYDLYNKVIKQSNPELNRRLYASRKPVNPQHELSFHDPKSGEEINTTIGKLARRVSSSHKFSYFLYKLVNHLNYKRLLETGTALGINTSYLAQTNASEIWTLEGVPLLADLAKSRLQRHRAEHVRIIKGNVRDTFRDALCLHPDLIFLDADHRYETIRWYLRAIHEQQVPVQCIVIHDIYWSADMHKAWQEIIKDDRYSLTVDIFQAGIIFPNHPIEKQHFTLRF